MQYQEFITKVQEETGADTYQDAEEITRATLSTLGERLYRTEREQLASQLPEELKAFLLSRQEAEPTTRQHTERYPLQEFYNRVGARSDAGYYDAAERAKAVISVLQQAVSAGQMEKVMDSLPDEYHDLLDRSQGPGFPSLG
jgi:uncharacterized protein (DUF2267 family)